VPAYNAVVENRRLPAIIFTWSRDKALLAVACGCPKHLHLRPCGRRLIITGKSSGLLQEKSFKKIYGDLYKGGYVSLSTMPKGYEKDLPAAATCA
jgi:hypothetical protein